MKLKSSNLLRSSTSSNSAALYAGSVGVPMLGNHPFLNMEHVEAQHLMMLAIVIRPTLANVNDHHVVVADYIQQLALIIRRQFLSETLAERVHESFQSGRHVRIMLDVVGPKKLRRRIYIAPDQDRRIRIADDSLLRAVNASSAGIECAREINASSKTGTFTRGRVPVTSKITAHNCDLRDRTIDRS